MNKEAKTKILILAIGLTIIIGLALAAMWFAPQPAMAGTVQIHNVFIDLNNDGLPDLLLSGEALINSGPLSVPTPIPGLPTQ
jgi:hypothetical protein